MAPTGDYTWGAATIGATTYHIQNIYINGAKAIQTSATSWTDDGTSTTLTYDSTQLKFYTGYSQNLNVSCQYKMDIDYVESYIYRGGWGCEARRETPQERKDRLLKEHREHIQRDAIQRRAEKLFGDIAGKGILRKLRKQQFIDVVSESGQRYRLRSGRMIEVMEGSLGENVLHKLCIHAKDYQIPQMDTLIMQYLGLTSGSKEEEELKKMAILHRVAS